MRIYRNPLMRIMYQDTYNQVVRQWHTIKNVEDHVEMQLNMIIKNKYKRIQ